MSGSHRTSTRGVARRRMAAAAGALGAAAAIAFAPAAQAATEVNTAQVVENNYTTWENLAKILGSSSAAQDAVLGAAAKPLPDGWMPTSTTTGGTTTAEVDPVQVLLQAGAMVLMPADVSHVPGLPATTPLGTALAQLLLGAPLVDQDTGILSASAAASGKIVSALGQLVGINGNVATKNTQAALGGTVPFVRSFRVISFAELLTGIPLTEAFATLPSGTRTTTEWRSTLAWPLLQAGGSTWLSNDRLTVDGVTSDDVRAAFAGLGGGGPLVTQKGKDKCGTAGCPYFQPSADPVVVFDPWAGVPAALSELNGIDIPGFSVIRQGVGGAYTLPGNGKVGWVGQATQVVIPGRGTAPDTIVMLPVTAGGIALPFDLLTTGGLYSPGLVTPSGQSVDAVLGSRSFGLAIPRAGLGLDSTSALESWHVGPDGLSVNTGWTLLLPQTGDTGLPAIPLVYSMGAYNVGPKGFGLTAPSLFGIGLPSFQVGEAPATSDGGGTFGDVFPGLDIPTTLISLDPKLLFSALNITDPTGLGLTDPIGAATNLLTPLYEGLVTPLATPLTQSGFDVGSRLITDGSERIKDATTKLVTVSADASDRVIDTVDKVDEVIPDAPESALDDVTIKEGADAVDNVLDEVEDTTEQVIDQARDAASGAGEPLSATSLDADVSSSNADGADEGDGSDQGDGGDAGHGDGGNAGTGGETGAAA